MTLRNLANKHQGEFKTTCWKLRDTSHGGGNRSLPSSPRNLGAMNFATLVSQPLMRLSVAMYGAPREWNKCNLCAVLKGSVVLEQQVLAFIFVLLADVVVRNTKLHAAVAGQTLLDAASASAYLS